MFMIEIAGVRILYTGDFSRQEDRHLMAAGARDTTRPDQRHLAVVVVYLLVTAALSETPAYTADIVIVESTYGVQIHEPRIERETRFTSTASTHIHHASHAPTAS